MRFKSLCTGVVATLLSVSALGADYIFDVTGQHAFVNFKVGHLGYSYIMGSFNQFEGSFTHDADNLSASKVSVTNDTSSLDPWGGYRRGGYRSGFTGTVDLEAGDFGMPGWVGVVQIELNIEGVRQ